MSKDDCKKETSPDITYSDDKRTITVDLDKGDWLWFAFAVAVIAFTITQVVKYV